MKKVEVIHKKTHIKKNNGRARRMRKLTVREWKNDQARGLGRRLFLVRREERIERNEKNNNHIAQLKKDREAVVTTA